MKVSTSSSTIFVASLTSTTSTMSTTSPLSTTLPGSVSSPASSSWPDSAWTSISADTPSLPLTSVSYGSPSGYVSTTSSSFITLPDPSLTGPCNLPIYSSVSADTVVTQFAILGCSNEHPDCCVYNPKDIAAGIRTLTKCPIDYFQTSGGCCPLCVITVTKQL
jgi:hypothetical protein